MHQDLLLIARMLGGKSNPTTFADGERARTSIYFSRCNIKCDECHSRINYNLRNGKLIYINAYDDGKELLKKYGDFEVIDICTYAEEILISIREGNE